MAACVGERQLDSGACVWVFARRRRGGVSLVGEEVGCTAVERGQGEDAEWKGGRCKYSGVNLHRRLPLEKKRVVEMDWAWLPAFAARSSNPAPQVPSLISNSGIELRPLCT